MPMEKSMSSPTSELINFNSEHDQILKAGAGAGKTTTLIRLFFESVRFFKNKNNQWPRIVLTTFTRKATQEIRERLLKECLSQNDHEIFHYLQSQYYVHISTIHGVLSLFLTQFSDRIDLPQDYQMVDESDLFKPRKKILYKILVSRPKLLDLLEQYQFSDLLSLCEKFREIATLKTAKSYSLDDLLLDVEKNHLQLRQEWLALSKEISFEALPDNWRTFVGFIQRYFNLNLDLKRNVELKKNEDLKRNIDQWIQEMYIFSEERPTKPRSGGKKSADLITTDMDSRIKELVKKIDDYYESYYELLKNIDQYQSQTEQIDELFKAYIHEISEWQKESGLISMKDLEILSVNIIRNDPQSAALFAKQWSYWMVDEYQDTSPLQVFLIENLKGSQPGFFVGDPQQSIYLFRGARKEVFDNKYTELAQSQAKSVYKQLVNYRSRPEVLNFINSFFTQISNQFEKMTVGQADRSTEQPACRIYFKNEKSDSWDCESVVHRINELMQKGAQASDICILSRNNKNLKKMADYLDANKNIPIQYYLHSSGSAYLRRDIQDALLILRFLDNPHDNINFIGLLRSPWFLIPDAEILKFCQGPSYWQNFLESRSEYSVIEKMQQWLDFRDQWGDLLTLRKILFKEGLFFYSGIKDPSGQVEAFYWKLIDHVESLQRQGVLNLPQILDILQNPDIFDLSDKEPSAVVEPSRVQLMTVHASKGLQFPHIIIMGFADEGARSKVTQFSYSEDRGQWSVSFKSKDNQQNIYTPLAYENSEILRQRESEESQRVLYVAMTRAQSTLTFVWAQEKKTGWSGLFPFDLSEGVHQEKGFSYEVIQSFELPIFNWKNLSEAMSEVDPYESKVQSDPTSISVTQLLNLQYSSQSKKMKHTFTQNLEKNWLNLDYEKSKKGQKLHRYFESIKYNSNLGSLFEDSDFKRAFDYIQSLSEPRMIDLIREGFVEWGFTVPWIVDSQTYYLIGQIDLWGIQDNTLWVVDYKTGSSNSLDKAKEQVQIYAESLKITKQVPREIKTRCVVLYPLEEKIEIF